MQPRSLSTVLSALPVVESAARHLSFTKAGSELRLTQPAVSRRIASLERQLGFPVFERRHNKLVLTSKGQQFLEAVEFSLGHVRDVISQISEDANPRKLTIACGFSFSSMWLQRRFSSFRKMLGDIEVHLIASEFPDDLDPEMIDVRVLWDDTAWQGRDERPLFPEVVHPVCSPGFRQSMGLAESGELSPERFTTLPLLYSRTSGPDRLDWEEWFRSQGVQFQTRNPMYIYDSYQFTVQAAVDGEGIALGYAGLIDDFIERGDLIRIGRPVVHKPSALRIEFEPNRLSQARRDLIYNWFRSESGQVG